MNTRRPFKRYDEPLAARLTFDLATRVESLEKSQQVLLTMLAGYLGKSVEETTRDYRKHYEQMLAEPEHVLSYGG